MRPAIVVFHKNLRSELCYKPDDSLCRPCHLFLFLWWSISELDGGFMNYRLQDVAAIMGKIKSCLVRTEQ